MAFKTFNQRFVYIIVIKFQIALNKQYTILDFNVVADATVSATENGRNNTCIHRLNGQVAKSQKNHGI